jgi:hypothetical protein
VAEPFLSRTAGAAVLDGEERAISPAIPGPVATVHDKSALRGFSIMNGGDSGVWGLGAVVISNNVISDNQTATVGGGIYLSTGANLSVPAATARIESNSILNNSSGGHGAGIYVDASAQGIPSRVVIDSNIVSPHTAAERPPRSAGSRCSPTPRAALIPSVVIRTTRSTATQAAPRWVLRSPTADPVATGGVDGVERRRSRSARPERQYQKVTTFRRGGWRSRQRAACQARATPFRRREHDLRKHRQPRLWGLHLFAYVFTPRGLAELVLGAAANSLTGNHALGDFSDPFAVGGGGVFAELYSERTGNATVQYGISGNSIQGNDATTHGGGASLLAYADDDPLSDGVTAPTGAVISFTTTCRDERRQRYDGQCLRAAHARRSLGVTRRWLRWRRASMVATTRRSSAPATRRAGPLAPTHWSFGPPFASRIYRLRNGYGGIRRPVGCVHHRPSPTTTGSATPGTTSPLGNPTGTNGNIRWTLSRRVLPPRICGPAVDRGPDDRCDGRALPNGGRVNLGHPETRRRALPDVNSDGTVDGLDDGIAVSFNSATGNPRFFTAADRDLNGRRRRGPSACPRSTRSHPRGFPRFR